MKTLCLVSRGSQHILDHQLDHIRFGRPLYSTGVLFKNSQKKRLNLHLRIPDVQVAKICGMDPNFTMASCASRVEIWKASPGTRRPKSWELLQKKTAISHGKSEKNSPEIHKSWKNLRLIPPQFLNSSKMLVIQRIQNFLQFVAKTLW